MAETLPEGTDHVIPGATSTERSFDDAPSGDGIKSAAADLKGQASAKASDLKSQASDKARAYAAEGKTRASDGLDSVAKLIEEQAANLDDKLGGTYGDYARRASSLVSDFSGALREKDVDELVDDARELVRKSPAVAIGAAAALGFAIARIVKAGSDALDEQAKTFKSPGSTAPGTADVETDTTTSAPKASAKSKPKTD
jgi:ElaB/YqjD/DUF883 family membrane-anchored ribosome-binding protein